MQAFRVLLAVALCVGGALVLPNVLIHRSKGVWEALRGADPATELHVLGRLRAVESTHIDIVVMGSSVAAVNVSEHLMSVETERAVFNAGVLGMPPEASSMYLDDVLALSPDVLVLVTGPLGFTEGTLPVSSPFDLNIAWAAFGARGLLRADVLSAALGEVSALYRLRAVPRLAWTGHLSGQASHPSNLPTLPRRRLFGVGRNAARLLARSPVVPDGTASRAIRTLIARAVAQDVSVLLVAAPEHPVVFGMDEQYYRPSHIEELVRIADSTHAVVVGPDDLPTWSSESFRDPTHLTKSGQRAFTRAIADALP